MHTYMTSCSVKGHIETSAFQGTVLVACLFPPRGDELHAVLMSFTLCLQLKRTHFHDFMLEVHSSLKKFHSSQDPLVQVADAVAREWKVLCLDEFFVNDVADAAILNRLFSRLWENGLVLVSTSNRAPDALYEGGLQRHLFLPFIEKLKVGQR